MPEIINKDLSDMYMDRIEAGFAKLSDQLGKFDERVRTLEISAAANGTSTTQRVDSAWRRIDQHGQELDRLTTSLALLSSSTQNLSNVLKWILGIVSAILTAVLVAFATGNLIIVTP